MEKLRKQIRESFFDPILHFLPLIVFLVVDDFWGMNTAWKVSFPLALILLIYTYIVYNRIFIWHLIFTLIFISVSIIVGIEVYLAIFKIRLELVSEIVISLFLFTSILFRKKIQKKILKVIPDVIPMSNNFEELYRVIWVFFSVLLFYITSFLLIQLIANSPPLYEHMLQYVYVCIILFLTIYEILRVQIIRAKLLREEWWPIVNNQGKIIGSIQHITSLNDERKYMHPVVRVLVVDKGMVLLQKRPYDSLVFPGLWDTAISDHVKMGETIEQCVDRASENQLLDRLKCMYLANYTIEVEQEKHYAFLFVSCQQSEITFNSDHSTHLKWWTQQQIEENLDTGIFTDNFKIEFELLQRSGLLETGKCECSCKLRDVIYHQSNIAKSL